MAALKGPPHDRAPGRTFAEWCAALSGPPNQHRLFAEAADHVHVRFDRLPHHPADQHQHDFEHQPLRPRVHRHRQTCPRAVGFDREHAVPDDAVIVGDQADVIVLDLLGYFQLGDVLFPLHQPRLAKPGANAEARS